MVDIYSEPEDGPLGSRVVERIRALLDRYLADAALEMTCRMISRTLPAIVISDLEAVPVTKLGKANRDGLINQTAFGLEDAASAAAAVEELAVV